MERIRTFDIRGLRRFHLPWWHHSFLLSQAAQLDAIAL